MIQCKGLKAFTIKLKTQDFYYSLGRIVCYKVPFSKRKIYSSNYIYIYIIYISKEAQPTLDNIHGGYRTSVTNLSTILKILN